MIFALYEFMLASYRLVRCVWSMCFTHSASVYTYYRGILIRDLPDLSNPFESCKIRPFFCPPGHYLYALLDWPPYCFPNKYFF